MKKRYCFVFAILCFYCTAMYAYEKTQDTSSVSEINGNAEKASLVIDSSTELNMKKVISGKRYFSKEGNRNTVAIKKAEINFDNIIVEKNEGELAGADDREAYGTNAALLAVDEAKVSIWNSRISTKTLNSAAVCVCGKNTSLNIEDSIIQTEEDNSCGIYALNGAKLNAQNLQIETKGSSSSAVRNESGDSVMNVNGGAYITSGKRSPAVYSTADVTVKNAVLMAQNSESVIIDGKGSVSLVNCTTSGCCSNLSEKKAGNLSGSIMIYQHESDGADGGNAFFRAEGGSIASKNGDMFYVTNTACSINLKKIKLKMDTDVLLRIEGNNFGQGWGSKGHNGGQVELTAEVQKLEGKILVDDISSLEISLLNRSSFEGVINPDGSKGNIRVVLDPSSKWIMTGHCYISSFDGNTTNIETNGFSLYVNGNKAL